MIQRIRHSRHDQSRTELFKTNRTLRPLRVMVDAELIEGADLAEWTRENLLAGFLTHEDIELWRYADDGPPSGTPVFALPDGTCHPIGWVVATPAASDGFVTHHLNWSDGKTRTYTGIAGNAVDVAASDTGTKAYETLAPATASSRRTADAVAACAAEQLKADLFITNREYLHRVSWSLGQGVTFCTPADALPLVSLYLRTQGDFLIWKDPTGKNVELFNRGLFYWVGARELLPAGWRWFTACVAHDAAQGTDDLIYLGGAVFQRITRALQVRDDLLRALNRSHDNDAADEALIALDTSLLFLMGALDASARVAHHVLGLPPGELYKAGWQIKNWLQDVAAKAPTLAAIVAPGTPGLDTVTILRLLRNTVHGSGLHAVAIIRSGHREETLVGLPRADSSKILAAADRQGGRSAWGLREIRPNEFHADPGVLFERLLPAVIALLSDLMVRTPVETLPGVALKPEDAVPPYGDDEPFAEHRRQSIRWQIGL